MYSSCLSLKLVAKVKWSPNCLARSTLRPLINIPVHFSSLWGVFLFVCLVGRDTRCLETKSNIAYATAVEDEGGHTQKKKKR